MNPAILSALLCLTLAGCAVAPAHLKDSDFVWESREIPLGYEAVYRNVRQTIRYCGGQYGMPEGDLDTTNRRARADIYLQNQIGVRLEVVLGVVEIASVDAASSLLKVGIQTRFDSPVFGETGAHRRRWLAFGAGDYSACPP